ncbi:antA/AntB antirepressor family protein [Rugamonas sp.]|uniref:antA/AntB antirepressor family protein n=1 Tax=Rugamonas sp. TaxID=1926287 RepID=UPI0025E4C2B3|nr:antA/AntB antirepressor family protein [Rugamonas sp.]
MSARQPYEILQQAAALIPTCQSAIGGTLMQTTSARDLHSFLKVGKDFSTWIKGRIEQFDFVENSDFVAVDSAPQNGGAGNRGARVEYALTLDMAKELSMVERNAQGKQARQYFIECERRALSGPALPNFADPVAAARAWADALDLQRQATAKAVQLEHQVAEQAPAVAGFDLIANSDGTSCIRDAAKLLQMKPHKLTEFLLLSKWIYHRIGKPGYVAYQDKQDAGYLWHKLGNYEDPETGERKVNEQVRITKRGLTKLSIMISSSPAGGVQGKQATLKY